MVIEDIVREVAGLWQTDELRRQKPTPVRATTLRSAAILPLSDDSTQIFYGLATAGRGVIRRAGHAGLWSGSHHCASIMLAAHVHRAECCLKHACAIVSITCAMQEDVNCANVRLQLTCTAPSIAS